MDSAHLPSPKERSLRPKTRRQRLPQPCRCSTEPGRKQACAHCSVSLLHQPGPGQDTELRGTVKEKGASPGQSPMLKPFVIRPVQSPSGQPLLPPYGKENLCSSQVHGKGKDRLSVPFIRSIIPTFLDGRDLARLGTSVSQREIIAFGPHSLAEGLEERKGQKGDKKRETKA